MRRGRILLALTGQGLAEIVNKTVPLVILHVVVARLGTAGYGLAEFGFGLVDLAIAFVVLGYSTIGAVDIGRAREDSRAVGRIISEVLTLKVISAVLTFFGLLLVITLVPRYEPYFEVVLALSFILFTTALDLSYVHIGTSRMFSLSLIIVGVKLTSLAAVLLFVHSPDDAVLFAVLNFGANGLIGSINFLYNLKSFPLSWPNREALIRRFMRSLPYALVFFWVFAIERFDLFVAEAAFGTEGAGLYGGQVRLVRSITHIIIAAGAVFLSESVGARSREELTHLTRFGTWALLALVAPLAAGTWFVDQQLVTLVLNSSFAPHAAVFSILVVALIGHALISVFAQQVLLVNERPGTMNLVLGIATGTGIAFAWILHEPFGLEGIATANAAVRIIAGLAFVLLAGRHLSALPAKEAVTTFVPAAVMAALLAALPTKNLWVLLASAVPAYAIPLVLMNRSKVRTFLDLIRGRLKPSQDSGAGSSSTSLR